jgi:tRNA pseudouridine55 synthase
MNGLLLVDKPKGWTSFDVVNKVRRIVAAELGKKPKNTKVGHTGTLDPLATGLLILVLGDYCKRAQEFSKLDKTYEVTMHLGVTSTTGDEEGVKTPVSDRQPVYEEVEDALKPFVGDIMQTPPNFSAIKVNGKRAYDLARAGQEVKLEARPVTIYSIDLTEYVYPEVKFTAHVGSGTYIRSLVEDVGKVLDTGAYMADLRRTAVGQWRLEKAISMEDISIDTITGSLLTP